MASEKAGMSASPDETQYIAFLIELIQAKNVIEIGVFKGYTTLAMALAVPKDGKVIALDTNEEYSAIGKKYWKKAGVEDKIDLRIGPAVESLQKLIDEGKSNTFDLAFIDADKPNQTNYYELCLKLIRPGGLILVDNVFWDGRVLESQDKWNNDTKAIVEANKRIKEDERVSISTIPIADGLTLC